MTTIGLSADHAGFELKEILSNYLNEKGYKVQDFGTYSLDSVDYPDFVHPMAQSVNIGTLPFGIAVCGSGQGVCMTANKHAFVRAALVWNKEIAALCREHNNANVMCLPARFISVEDAKSFVDIFLATSFAGGRHETRVEKI
jgi:ribose 5-phosphate isomerase B